MVEALSLLTFKTKLDQAMSNLMELCESVHCRGDKSDDLERCPSIS